MQTTDWWLPEGKGEMDKGGQLYGDGSKLDVEVYTRYQITMLSTYNSYVINQCYLNFKRKKAWS